MKMVDAGDLIGAAVAVGVGSYILKKTLKEDERGGLRLRNGLGRVRPLKPARLL